MADNKDVLSMFPLPLLIVISFRSKSISLTFKFNVSALLKPPEYVINNNVLCFKFLIPKNIALNSFSFNISGSFSPTFGLKIYLLEISLL